jgi:hypothetical protein
LLQVLFEPWETSFWNLTKCLTELQFWCHAYSANHLIVYKFLAKIWLGDFEHLGHISSSHTNENLEKCISQPWCCMINNVCSFLSKFLSTWIQMAVKFVPCVLNDYREQNWHSVCKNLQDQARNMETSFISFA